jgi:hypothetical protein
MLCAIERLLSVFGGTLQKMVGVLGAGGCGMVGGCATTGVGVESYGSAVLGDVREVLNKKKI